MLPLLHNVFHVFWLPKALGFRFPTLLHVSHDFSIILGLFPSSSNDKIKREKNAVGLLPKASGPQFLWLGIWGPPNCCCHHYHCCLRFAWYWDENGVNDNNKQKRGFPRLFCPTTVLCPVPYVQNR